MQKNPALPEWFVKLIDKFQLNQSWLMISVNEVSQLSELSKDQIAFFLNMVKLMQSDLPESQLADEILSLGPREVEEKVTAIDIVLSRSQRVGLQVNTITHQVNHNPTEHIQRQVVHIGTQNNFFGASGFSNASSAYQKSDGPFHDCFGLPPAFEDFTGREDSLSLVEANIGETTVISHPKKTVSGTGGIGKTQLAVTFAHSKLKQYRETHGTEGYRSVIWFIAGSDEEIDNQGLMSEQLNRLGQQLGLDPKQLNPNALVKLIFQRLSDEHGPYLVIFDNAQNMRSIKHYLPPSPVPVIITTRNSNERDWDQSFKSISLSVFTEKDAHTYIKKVLCRNHPDLYQEAEANALAKALGFFPLALTQALAYLTSENIRITDYLEEYSQQKANYLQEPVPQGDPYQEDSQKSTIWAVVQLSLSKVINTEAKQILKVCAYLAPEAPIDLKLLAYLCTSLSHCREAVRALRRYSLLENVPEAGHIRVHQMVQEIVRLADDQETRSVWLECIVGLISQQYESNENPLVDEARRKTLFPHLQAVLRHFERLSKMRLHFEIAFAVLKVYLGNAYSDMGNYLLSRQCFEEALEVVEHSDDQLFKARILMNLGITLSKLGDAARAKGLYERALTIQERILGPNNSEVARTLVNLGSAINELGDFIGAKTLHERALAIKERVFGPDHFEVTSAVMSLGIANSQLGNKRDAKVLFERALAIIERTYGPNHPFMAKILGNIGLAMSDLGDFTGVKALHERALAIKEQVFGPNHLEMIGPLQHLGYTILDLGDAAGAKALFEHALAIEQRTFGSDHPAVAKTLGSLSLVMRELDDFTSAKVLLERALAIFKHCYGSGHPQVAKTLSNLALNSNDSGDHVGAKTLYERALEIEERTLGHDHIETTVTRMNLASTLSDLGQHVLAVLNLQRCMQVFSEKLGEQHPHTCTAKEMMLEIQHCTQDGRSPKQLTSEKQIYNIDYLFGRQGLFTHQKKHRIEQEALFSQVIPEGFELGAAKGKGDCFHDSCAQELNKCSGENEYTIKSLRLLFHEYAVELNKRCNANPKHPDNWISKALNHDPRKYQEYLANVQYTVEEREAEEGVGDDKLALWRELHIDGRILCERLGVKLHVIEVRENPEDETNKTQKFILSHILVDEAGLKNVEEDKVDWINEKLLHIAVCNRHFVPILRKTLKQNYVPNKISVQHNDYNHHALFLNDTRATNDDFTGREGALVLLENYIGQSTIISDTKTIMKGIGGIGKTQLALTFAQNKLKQYRETQGKVGFRSVIWFIAGTVEGIDNQGIMAAQLHRLGQLLGFDPEKIKPDVLPNLIFQRLSEEHGPYLVVYDNAYDHHSIKTYLPPPSVPVIITTRNNNECDWDQTYKVISLSVFTIKEAHGFIKNVLCRNHANLYQEEEANALAEVLGYFPLAITLALAYITTENIPITKYLEAFSQQKEKLFENDPAEDKFIASPKEEYDVHKATAWTVVQLSLNKVISADANQVLKACAYLAAETPIDMKLLAYWCASVAKCREAVTALRQYKLVENDHAGRHVRIHHLVQEVVRQKDKGESKEVFLACVTKFIGKHAMAHEHPVVDEIRKTAFYPHLQTVLTHLEGLKNMGNLSLEQEIASLQFYLGSIYLWMGNHIQSRLCLEESLKTSERLGNQTFLGLSLRNLGSLAHDLGDAPGAKLLLTRALAIQEDTYPLDPPQIGTTLLYLGMVTAQLGDQLIAKNLFERALALYERFLGSNHPNVAIALVNLGDTTRELDDLAGAKAMYESALRIHQGIFGADDPNLAIILVDLAIVTRELGNSAGAKALYERALLLYERKWGSDHPELALLLVDLGKVTEELGDTAAAKILYERALRINEELWGPEHTELVSILERLSEIYLKLGEVTGAKTMQERALVIEERRLGLINPEVARILTNLGHTSRKLGDVINAQRVFERALAIYEHNYGQEHSTLVSPLLSLGIICRELGDVSGATTLLERALTMGESFLSPDHINVALIHYHLGNTMNDLEQPMIAFLHFQKCLPIFSSYYGKQHQFTMEVQEMVKELGNAEGQIPTPFALSAKTAAIKEPSAKRIYDILDGEFLQSCQQLLLIAKGCFDLEMISEALKLLEIILEMETSVDGLLLRARCQLGRSDFSAASETASLCHALSEENNLEVNALLGKIEKSQLQAMQWQAEIDYLQSQSVLSPTDQIKCAINLRRLSRYEEALKLLDAVIASRPIVDILAPAYFNRAVCYFRLHRYDEAQTSCEESYRLKEYPQVAELNKKIKLATEITPRLSALMERLTHNSTHAFTL